MPSEKIQAPRGTFDVLPEEGRRRAELFDRARPVMERAGYEPIDTPCMEATELFARGVGESTDIVQKEMFSFEDGGGRSLTLRPEGTAGICRAYVEHGMHKRPQPVKLWYWGPFFRYEAPQAGRHRQFTQVGVEALGSDDPSVDAEVILLLSELLEAAGAREVRLRIGSLGTPETRRAYSDELREFLREREDQLSDDVRARLDANPLRAFDSDHPGTRAAVSNAPRLLDRLEPDDAEHFDAVRAFLDAAGQGYEVDGTLVRGLDYYTRTVFEFTSDALGAQSGVGGGGRYDRLVEQLGGQPTPAVGWAAGVERILLASGGESEVEPPDVLVAGTGAAPFLAVLRARRAGKRAHLEQGGRSLKGIVKHADRLRARHLLYLGPDESWLKDMATGEQEPVDDVDAAVDRLT